MSFFIRNTNQRGAKRKNGTTPDSGRPKSYKEKKRLAKDDEISSHSEDEAVDDSKVYSGSEDEDETVQEKRLRLTKEYLKEIENQGTTFFLLFISIICSSVMATTHFLCTEREKREEADIDKSVIAHRLKEDILEHSGKLRRTVADLYEAVDESLIKHLHCKDHKQPITCMTISQDCKWLFTASKDCTIVKWCLVTMKRVAAVKRVEKKAKAEVKGHKTAIQSISISTDGKFLASGDQENQVYIWASIF